MAAESVQVSEGDNGAGGVELVVTSPHWRLRVDWGEQLDPYELVHLASGRAVADESYCYRLTVSGATDSGFHGGPVSCRRVRPLDWSAEQHDDSGATLTLLGQLDFGPQGPTGLRLEHRITLAGPGEVIEQISLLNHAGQDQLRLDGFRFGFRKTLFDRGRWAWQPGCEDAELIPVPLRRFRAQDVDHLRSGYRAADLYPSEWPGRDSLPAGARRPGCGPRPTAASWSPSTPRSTWSTAWPTASTSWRAARPARRPRSSWTSCTATATSACATAGPVSTTASRRPPASWALVSASASAPRSSWPTTGTGRPATPATRRSCATGATSRPAATTRGCTGTSCTASAGGAGRTPPCRSCPSCSGRRPGPGPRAPRRSTSTPAGTCSRAAPVWDTGRLGPVEEFVRRLRDEYGLSLALHLMIHTKSVQEDPAIYRRRPDGEIDLWTDRTPYSGGYVCPASPVWQRQKNERLLRLARAGASFFMFDFVTYGPCWSAEHGHRSR